MLDVRALSPPSLADHVHVIEAAAIRAVVALVMKLTESRFKPLFLRLLEWAAVNKHGSEDDFGGDEEAAAAAALGRQVTLFGVSGALAERLRSVFVPYFRYLVDKAAKHLSSEAPGGTSASQAGKKRRKQAPTAADVARSAASEGGSVASWVLRMRVVRSLHRALLYDTAGFFDAEKLDRLLGPLVSQVSKKAAAVIFLVLSRYICVSVTILCCTLRSSSCCPLRRSCQCLWRSAPTLSSMGISFPRQRRQLLRAAPPSTMPMT